MKLTITLLASLVFCLGIHIANCTRKKNPDKKEKKPDEEKNTKHHAAELIKKLMTTKGPKQEIINALLAIKK